MGPTVLFQEFKFQYELCGLIHGPGGQDACLMCPGNPSLVECLVSSRDTIMSCSQFTRPLGVRIREPQARPGGRTPLTRAAYIREWLKLYLYLNTKHIEGALEDNEEDSSKEGLWEEPVTQGQSAAHFPDFGLSWDYVPLNRGTDTKWVSDIPSQGWEFTKDRPPCPGCNLWPVYIMASVSGVRLLWILRKAETFLRPIHILGKRRSRFGSNYFACQPMLPFLENGCHNVLYPGFYEERLTAMKFFQLQKTPECAVTATYREAAW